MARLLAVGATGRPIPVAKDKGGTDDSVPPAYRPALPPRKVFVLPKAMPRIFYGRRDFLADNALSLVDDPHLADIIIARRAREFTDDILALGRLNVVWTKEPFDDKAENREIKVNGQTIHIFNLYNYNVYTDNYFDLPKTGATLIDRDTLNVPFANRQVVAVMTRKDKMAFVQGRERSLLRRRAELVLNGYEAGGIDVYGAGWPEGVSRGENRTQRHHRVLKQQILAGYNYNLCMENCSWDYYVTEKMWEGAFGHCLPIYYANDTIRQLPFIDATILIEGNPTFPAIADAIDRINEAEFVERLNTIIAAGNRAIELGLGVRSVERSQNVFASFLRATV